MASDTLGYMPLSKRRVPRLDRQTKILMGLAFLAGITLWWTVGYIRRVTSLGPLSSALDNYQQMCVSLISLANAVILSLLSRQKSVSDNPPRL